MTLPPSVNLDTPLGGLPPAEPVLHASHNLELVVVEIRYTGATGTFTSDDALTLRDALLAAGVRVPAIEAVANQEVAFQVGPDGPDAKISTREVGWQLSAPDGSVSAVLTSDVIRLQTTGYTRWSESLAKPLEIILVAAQPVLQPQLVARVGVRFINRFVNPDARHPRDWTGSIEGPFLGPVLDEMLGDKIISTQQQMEISLGAAQGAIVRHGAFVDAAERGGVSYLLDIDMYNQAGLRADTSVIMEEATRLDRTALTLFQRITTSEMRAQMRPYRREDTDGSQKPRA